MKHLIITISSIFILSSCSSPIDKTINLKTAKEDIESLKIKYKDDYTESDFEYLKNTMAGGIFAKAMLGDKVDENIKLEKTYKDVLEEAKSKRVAYENKMMEYNKSIDEFKNIITAGVNNKRVDGEYEYEREVGLNVIFENKSDKTINGVKGYFEVYDMFDNLIHRLNFQHTEPIKAKSKSEQGFFWKVGYNEEMKKVAYEDLNKLRFKWFPETIIYEDGNKETAPALPEK